uniref:hypothetical protein n=1 Tax=Lachnospira eligens TaxID=39485 RepID=UPI00402A5BF7
MTIVFGAGKEAETYIREFSGTDEIVCYDNDRRKWGKTISGIPIITLEKYLETLRASKCKIIDTISNKTALYFLKDTCGEMHEVYCLHNKELKQLNLNDLRDYERELEAVESEKIKKYKAIVASGQIKSEFALEHYKKYIRHRENDYSWPEINSVELTNYCNLKCPNCPTPTCKRPKGFMPKEVFDKQKADDLLELLSGASKSKLFISFHTKTSVENWKNAVELLQQKQIKNVELFGQILEHNESEAIGWLSESGINDPFNNQYIRYVTSHSFAGGVEGRRTCYSDVEVKNRFRNCYFVKNNCTAVAWDGRLKVCCLDSELEGIGGTVFDVEKLTHKNTPYKLCHYCDPDWTSNYQ